MLHSSFRDPASTLLNLVFINRFFYPDISATSQLLGDLAFHLAADGHRVTVLTSRQLYQDPRASLSSSECVQNVQVFRVASTAFGRERLIGRAVDYLSFYMSGLVALWKLASPGHIIVAKTDPPLISVIAAFVCRARGARLVNWVQDVFPEIVYSRQRRRWMSRLLVAMRNSSLRSAYCNVVLGRRMASYLESAAGRGLTISIIPNWIDGSLVRPVDIHRNPLRQQWGLGEKFVVSYSGNMGRVHEFDTIVAAAELLNNRPDICFLFIGDGRWRKWIEEKTMRQRCANIVFKPYQSREMLSLSLGVADVHLVSLQPQMEGLVVPSKFYGIAAAGRPTLFVGDPDGEIAGVLAKHDIGITIRPGQAEDLASTLVSLKADSARRYAMGERARAVFDAEYDKPIAVAKWKEVLRNVGQQASNRAR